MKKPSLVTARVYVLPMCLDFSVAMRYGAFLCLDVFLESAIRFVRNSHFQFS